MTVVERNTTNNLYIFQLARTQSTQLNRENTPFQFWFVPWNSLKSCVCLRSNILWFTSSPLQGLRGMFETRGLHVDAPSLRIRDTWRFKLFQIASDTRVIPWREMMSRFSSRNADSQRSSNLSTENNLLQCRHQLITGICSMPLIRKWSWFKIMCSSSTILFLPLLYSSLWR